MIRSIGLERLARWCAGALVLLLAHGLVAPRSATAGCNHLVTSRSDRQFDVHHLDDLITGGTIDAAADDEGRPGPRAPRPCSGPGCSSSIPRPASTASPSSVGPDQWVVMGTVPSEIVAAPPRVVPDETAARPVGRKPSIFHPPPV